MEEQCRRDATVAHDVVANERTKEPCNEVQFPGGPPSFAEAMLFDMYWSSQRKAFDITSKTIDLHVSAGSRTTGSSQLNIHMRGRSPEP